MTGQGKVFSKYRLNLLSFFQRICVLCFVFLTEKMSDHAEYEETMESVRKLEASLQNYWGNINEKVPKVPINLFKIQINLSKRKTLIRDL